MRIEINEIDHKGNGIGKIDNKIVFVPKCIKGDICEGHIVLDYKNYSIARVDKLIKKSNDRVDSKCPYYMDCGGCNISNLSYENQLIFKKNKVKNIFKKYLNMDIDPIVIGSEKELGYRNKIVYHCQNNKLGLIGEFDNVISVDRCLLVSDRINKLYDLIKREDLSEVNKVTIRECDNGLILDVDGDIVIDNLKKMCISIYINGICKHKNADGYININNIKYIVSNKSFFQANTCNISKLYDEIVRYGNFSKSDRVIDLYCGVGSISLYISQYVHDVLGIEIIKSAVDDAITNAKINAITNAKFLCGDVSKLSGDELLGDVLIVDPPRIGLNKKTVSIINDKKIAKLIYVSCDAMTLVRDIKALTNYTICGISIVDMFPQTHHCESIVLLKLK